MKLLIVDDNVSIRMLLYATAEYSGFEPLLACNGSEAKALFQENPDIALVLTDVYMPEVDGIALARFVREQKRAVHVPVVFMTGENADELLAEFLETADDIIIKPFSQTVILAKLAAHRRLVEIHRQLAEQNQTLQQFRHVTEVEHFVASEVIQRSMSGGLSDLPGVCFQSFPMSSFNGDSVVLSRNRSGGCYFLVTDVSGHGLPAAMGTLPLIEAFLTASWEASNVGGLAERMNANFCKKMPDYLLASLLLGEIDACGSQLHLWNGGMPPVVLLDKHGCLKRILASEHMPLGALHAAEFKHDTTVIHLEEAEQLLCFSDGIIEARNPSGNMFGMDGLLNCLGSLVEARNVVEHVVNAVALFKEGAPANDDVTIFSYRNSGVLPECDATMVTAEQKPPVPRFFARFDHTADALSNPDCLQQTLGILRAYPQIGSRFGKVATVVTELFNNALEHAVLKMESSLKNAKEGMAHYLDERARRLSQLDAGAFISIEISLYAGAGESLLQLVMTDSGSGFEVPVMPSADSASSQTHGRGLEIVKALAESLVFENRGRRAIATLRL